MSDNLSIIIDYINDNLRFGSKLNIEKVEELFKKYRVSDSEMESVFTELNSLNIEIVHSKGAFNEKISRLFKYIGPNKELRETKLNKWFETEKIDRDMQKRIRHSLNISGYTIINEVHRDINFEDFDFLDEFNFEELDVVLDNDSFNDEVSKLKNVVDKSHNLEYLVDLHSSKEDFRKREQALDNLVNANKKLVWEIALRYKQFSTVSFDNSDMYQAGVLGLMKAAEKFDISKGNQFSTYATWWVRQSITRSIADYSTTIRIPVHMREKIIKYVSTENKFWNENGRVASKEELANLLGISSEEVNYLQVYQDVANLTSLDIPIGADEGSFLGEFIPDDKHRSPEKSAEEGELKRELKEICEGRLTPKETRILNFRFGFIDGRTHTLEEIGHVENVTRERIRQIEAKAISKLQNPKILERLRDFYYDRK
ncbi:sigma-70 family RNA polymerase sigma factor [Clostridium cellulovorans]|uniref:RNA polymerase, sigma 32 subunit, RpoH n=1 Tax=Clostridium cellulovorans (strain ATCC 35296 / DSM 3052 / OCM 3 / 743B) TaxID=573061 RepID=D9SWJ0_CLOC7|nr:sigma-70 family RNA polymerase sigma factor [Clostridium cellulovorans]ADL53272.1 RNA polymerase, sigma 32 subunit, RpoH [Clostridium cellulovorans 743B]